MDAIFDTYYSSRLFEVLSMLEVGGYIMDKTSKAILTVIAVALCAIAFKLYFHSSSFSGIRQEFAGIRRNSTGIRGRIRGTQY